MAGMYAVCIVVRVQGAGRGGEGGAIEGNWKPAKVRYKESRHMDKQTVAYCGSRPVPTTNGTKIVRVSPSARSSRTNPGRGSK